MCTLMGDADNSGRVTTADYSQVKAHMGERTDSRYDLNGSGRITTADYSVVKNHMGQRRPPRPGPCACVEVPALVTVQVVDEYFVVRVIDQELLDQMVNICDGIASQKIVVGELRYGNPGYNCDPYSAICWSWHLDEDTIALADMQ